MQALKLCSPRSGRHFIILQVPGISLAFKLSQLWI